MGRLVAIARGDQEYFDPSGIPIATEACKSIHFCAVVKIPVWLVSCGALQVQRFCCRRDVRFVRESKERHCVEVWGEHNTTKKKKKLWRRNHQAKLDYPYRE
ncbi:mitochondrial genome maintenance MGM101 [Pisolithus albus]|nr:mitochondrial genome maintenance MGM101 [Pisolithus albus]